MYKHASPGGHQQSAGRVERQHLLRPNRRFRCKDNFKIREAVKHSVSTQLPRTGSPARRCAEVVRRTGVPLTQTEDRLLPCVSAILFLPLADERLDPGSARQIKTGTARPTQAPVVPPIPMIVGEL